MPLFGRNNQHSRMCSQKGGQSGKTSSVFGNQQAAATIGQAKTVLGGQPVHRREVQLVVVALNLTLSLKVKFQFQVHFQIQNPLPATICPVFFVHPSGNPIPKTFFKLLAAGEGNI